MAYQFLDTRRDGPIEYLTLNRPEVRNAFNERVIEELTRWAGAIASDERVRVVVIAGAGKAFCAIGRIHGAALGGGAGLAAVCDIAVADEQAIFGFTETKLGIVPAIISPYVLTKIGMSAARELFLTGMRFDAARAKEIGLVHCVVPEAELDACVNKYVAELLTAAPGAIATAKELLRKLWGRPVQDTIGITTDTIAARRVSEEGQEGMRAFLEKRKARWNLPTSTTSPCSGS